MVYRRIALDTNVFVAAEFDAESGSAQVSALLREGRHSLVWNEATRDEPAHTLCKIPPLDWDRLEAVFDEAPRYDGPFDVSAFDVNFDRDERKIASLAHAASAVLVTTTTFWESGARSASAFCPLPYL